MFIRLKKPDGSEVNLNSAQIVGFYPSADGSEVLTSSGVVYQVVESNRTIRHAIKKASAASEPTNDE